MGGRENPRSDDGFRRRSVFGNREKAEKKANDRLSMGKPQIQQLVRLQVLLLRGLGLIQCYR